VGEADFGSTALNNCPEHMRDTLAYIAADRVECEQYMDFIKNRMFRQSIVCHAAMSLSHAPSCESLTQLHVASPAEPDREIIDVHSTESVVFRRNASTLTTSTPEIKAAMLHLHSVWPRSVPYQELFAVARSTVVDQSILADCRAMQSESADFASTLLRCYETSVIDLHAVPAEIVVEVDAFPYATPLTRAQAERGEKVANRRHRATRLNEVGRFVLSRLDGQLNREALVECVCRAVEQGELVLAEAGGLRVTDPVRVRPLAQEIVLRTLADLAEKALLVPATV
jgi:methyltransferase-like protein